MLEVAGARVELDEHCSVVLSLPPTVVVFVALAPLDMRGSFDSLPGAVRQFAEADSLTPRAVEQMVLGVSTRKYVRSIETAFDGPGRQLV